MDLGISQTGKNTAYSRIRANNHIVMSEVRCGCCSCSPLCLGYKLKHLEEDIVAIQWNKGEPQESMDLGISQTGKNTAYSRIRANNHIVMSEVRCSSHGCCSCSPLCLGYKLKHLEEDIVAIQWNKGEPQISSSKCLSL
jgi:hypothetical protein